MGTLKKYMVSIFSKFMKNLELKHICACTKTHGHMEDRPPNAYLFTGLVQAAMLVMLQEK